MKKDEKIYTKPREEIIIDHIKMRNFMTIRFEVFWSKNGHSSYSYCCLKFFIGK
jgi:hypothetical protein